MSDEPNPYAPPVAETRPAQADETRGPSMRPSLWFFVALVGLHATLSGILWSEDATDDYVGWPAVLLAFQLAYLGMVFDGPANRLIEPTRDRFVFALFGFVFGLVGLPCLTLPLANLAGLGGILILTGAIFVGAFGGVVIAAYRSTTKPRATAIRGSLLFLSVSFLVVTIYLPVTQGPDELAPPILFALPWGLVLPLWVAWFLAPHALKPPQ